MFGRVTGSATGEAVVVDTGLDFEPPDFEPPDFEPPLQDAATNTTSATMPILAGSLTDGMRITEVCGAARRMSTVVVNLGKPRR